MIFPLDKPKGKCYNKYVRLRDARAEPKTQVVAVRRNPTKTTYRMVALLCGI